MKVKQPIQQKLEEIHLRLKEIRRQKELIGNETRKYEEVKHVASKTCRKKKKKKEFYHPKVEYLRMNALVQTFREKNHSNSI